MFSILKKQFYVMFLSCIPFLYLQRSAKHRWLITGRLHLPIPLLWRGINSRLHAMMVTLSKKGSFHHLLASAMVPGIEYPPVLQMVPIGFFQQSLDPAVKQKTLVVEYFPLSVCFRCFRRILRQSCFHDNMIP